MGGAKVVLVMVIGVLGALFALGCVLAALFELQGFGGPRDTDPRTWYLLACAAGAFVCVIAPLALWRALLPDTAPALPVIAFVGSAVVVVMLLGLIAGR
jgi:hypothetical protein